MWPVDKVDKRINHINHTHMKTPLEDKHIFILCYWCVYMILVGQIQNLYQVCHDCEQGADVVN